VTPKEETGMHIARWIAKGYLTGKETATEYKEMARLSELVDDEHESWLMEFTWDEAVDGDIAEMPDRREERGIWCDAAEIEDLVERFHDTVLEPLYAPHGYYVTLRKLLEPLMAEHQLPAGVLLVWLERQALAQRLAYLIAEGALIA